MRSCSRVVLFAVAAVALAGCGNDPAEVAGVKSLTYEYSSSVQPGTVPAEEAGFCAHHMLGSSWLDFVVGSDESVQLFRVGNEPARYRGSNLVPAAGIEFQVAIRDLECCTHTPEESCWATEGLSVEGVPLTRVVAIPSATDPDRVGLSFRVDRSGRVLP